MATVLIPGSNIVDGGVWVNAKAMGASFTSDKILRARGKAVSFVLSIPDEATREGTIIVEGTSTPSDDASWVQVSFQDASQSTTTATITSTGVFGGISYLYGFQIAPSTLAYYRIRWSRTSGTNGAMTVFATVSDR